MALTKKQVMAMGPAYRKTLALNEALFDAVLDLDSVNLLDREIDESDEEFAVRLIEEKIRLHDEFAEGIAQDVADGKPVELPNDFAMYQADFIRIRERMSGVTGFPQSRYDSSTRLFVERLTKNLEASVLTSMSQTHSLDEMPVMFYSDAKHGMGVYELNNAVLDAYPQGAAEFRPWDGRFMGTYGTAHQDAYNTMVNTDGILLLSQYLSEHGEMPLSLSEAQAIRQGNDGMGIQVDYHSDSTDMSAALMDAFRKVRPVPEGKFDVFDRNTDFGAWMENNWFIQDALLEKYGRMGTVDARNMAFGARMEYLDVFGRDANGLNIGNTEAVQAFLNESPSLQQVFTQDEEFTAFAIDPDNMLYIRTSEKGTLDAKVYQHIGPGVVRNLGSLVSEADRLGVSQLKPYLGDEVYAEYLEKLSSGMFADTEPNLQAIRNGLAVFEELDRRGFSYTVEADRNNGQLKACVESPKIDFRVMDLNSPDKVGRAWVNGSAIYFKTEKMHPEEDGSGKRIWKHDIVMPTEQMARDLVAYSLGERVLSPDQETLVLDGKQVSSTENWVGRQGTLNAPAGPNATVPVSKSVRMLDGSGNKNVAYNATYMGKERKFTAFYSLQKNPRDLSKSYPVSIYADGSARNSIQLREFESPDAARDWVLAKMDMASANFKELTLKPILETRDITDVLGHTITMGNGHPMFEAVDAKPEEELLSMELSADPNIRALQENYVRYLTTDNAILRGSSEEDVREVLQSDTLQNLDLFKEDTLGHAVDKHLEVMTNLDNIQNTLFGHTEDFGESGLPEISLNVAHILEYSDATADEMILALQAMQKENEIIFLNETGEFTMNRVKEKMVVFDEGTSFPIAGPTARHAALSEFQIHIGEVVQESLLSHGLDVSEIRMDENGIIQYKGLIANGMTEINGRGEANTQEVVGTIGQVFEPDENGVIVTHFNHEDNHAIVPGYKAFVSRGESSMESRTVLKGYQQMLDEQIRISVHSNFLRGDFTGMNNTQLNSVYRHMYDERLPEDYRSYFKDMGMGDELMHATIDTLKGAVRFPTSYRDDSSLNARLDAMDANIVNDCNSAGFSVTKRDVAILADSERGYFDMIATSTGVTQGLTRYLVEGAQVAEDGHIIPSEDKADKCPILKLDVCRNVDYNPFDRQQMTFSNLMSCFNVADGVGTAHMTLEGWTFDDGYVVSKDFAELYSVPVDSAHPENGRRPMKKGDKICDFNGNKGVINLVVDRAMHSEAIQERMMLDEKSLRNNPDGTVSYNVKLDDKDYVVSLPSKLEEGETYQHAAALDVQKQLGYAKCDNVIRLFEKNLDLDVVGAPFTAPSRMNGGTARGMMEDAVELEMPNGEIRPGGMGYIPFIITDMTVDEKTHIYDDEEMAKGKGRSASSQLAWALQASGAEAIMKEFYGDNIDNMRTIRERMIALGLDFDEDYNIVNGYHPHQTENGIEERRVIELPSLPDHPEDLKPRKHPEDIRNAKAAVSMELSQSGGFMRIPFEITFPTGEVTQKASDGNGYLLPVLPTRYRADQTYDDNTAIVHDYTKKYLEIADAALQYAQAERLGDAKGMAAAKVAGQKGYNDMSTDLQSKYFEGKYNQWKKLAMGRKLPNSATAVWTGDPRLDLDQVAMNEEMAKKLGVKEDDYVMTWRDPLLRKEGVAGLRVVIDNTLSGVAINPAMDKRYDGDFDGDSIALVGLQSEAAKAELIEKFAVKNTLYDLGPTGYNPKDPSKVAMAVNTGLDVASAIGSSDKENRNVYEDMLTAAKEYICQEDYDKAMDMMNQYIHKAYSEALGSDHILYGSMEGHLKSVDVMVSDHKAKGKTPKLQEYCDYLGVKAVFTRDENGKITHLDAANCVDKGIPDILSDDPERYAKGLDMASQTQQATSIKSQGTGVAGAFSQRGVKACRDDCIASVTETTYGATQGILQAKHDAKEAEQKYMILRDPLPALWRGQAICEKNGVWTTAYNPDGKPIWNDRQGFIDQYTKLCNSGNGLNFDLSKEHIEQLASSLYVMDPDKGFERIRNVYKADVAGVSPLDRLAYGGNFDTLKDMAGKANLFDGKGSSMFKPEGSLASEVKRAKTNNFARQHSNVKVQEQETAQEMAVDVRVNALANDTKATLKGNSINKALQNGEDMNAKVAQSGVGLEACID